MHKYPVSISLSSYGADLVRQQGQSSFVEVLAAAGAQRIEWREELLTHEQPQELAEAAANQDLESVFSSPLELWVAGRAQPNAELAANARPRSRSARGFLMIDSSPDLCCRYFVHCTEEARARDAIMRLDWPEDYY